MQFSLSAYRSFQRCEQKYFYGYVRKLRSKVKEIAPQKGVLIHRYMETYYKGLQSGVGAKQAHLNALGAVEDKREETLVAIQTAYMAGREDLAIEYSDLIDGVKRICSRYFEVRGLRDALEHEVLHVELQLNVWILNGVNSMSYVDMITRDRSMGRTWLWEHKSTKLVPDSAYRITDMQTFLYGEKSKRLYGIKPDGVIWNYLRTKEPSEPEMLKTKGKGLSRDKRIDTTAEVYEAAIRKNGLEVAAYSDMLSLLEGREESVFFPRFEQVISPRADLMMNDYVRTASRAYVARAQWEAGSAQPVRVLDRSCSFCEYRRLCETVLTGGDEEDVIGMYFRQGGDRDAIAVVAPEE